MKDPYSVLGVSKSASQDEIKNAYRAIAKKNHPDLNPGNKEKEAKFKEAAHAYEQIGTPEARAKFDRGETEEAFQGAGGSGARSGPFYYQTGGQAGGPGGRYSYDFGQGFDEDIFENLFRGGGRAGARGRGQAQDWPGEDQLFQMEVDFRDAVLGAEREITLPGAKKLSVKIPAGLESGTRLRFRGQGGPGHGKGPAGDAYVEVRVRPHPLFTRNGQDLETEVPIAFYDALSGAEIAVPTIEGRVALQVPPGVSTGSRLRVKGHGVASARGERGDLYVRLKIAMPKNPSADLQSEAREWKKKFSYDPGGQS